MRFLTLKSFAQGLVFCAVFSSCQTPVKTEHKLPGASRPVSVPTTNNGASSPLETKDYILVETDEPTDSRKQQAPTDSTQNPVVLPSPQSTQPNGATTPVLPQPAPSPQQWPRIGLIMSGGGAKTFAHIGVLQEFQKEKIPLHSVIGLEFAAPLAALYAWKGFANDVEWQSSKLKENDAVKKSLITSQVQTGDVSQLNDFLKLVFQNLKVEDLKKPFACPIFNLERNQVTFLERGGLDQILPYCMAYPPLFKPYSKIVAAVRELKLSADHLRAKGATYIVFVNVLGGAATKKSIGNIENSDGVLMAELISFYSKPQLGVDAMISINLEDYGLTNFDKRTEIIQKGAEQSRPQLRVLSQRLGL